MSKILITGGAGFIGSHLAEKLSSLSHEIIVIDNFESGKTKNLAGIVGKIKIIKGDIGNKALIEKSLLGIETIFHLAAKVTVPESFNNKKSIKRVNVAGTTNLLEAAYKYRIKKIIFASSAAVYGNIDHFPICEVEKLNPISPLGKTKLEAEKYCHLFRKKGLEAIILRFFNVYGPRQNPTHENVIPGFIGKIANNQSSVIYGDGRQTRDFIYIDDVVDACLASLERNTKNSFIFNIGTGKETSINLLSSILCKIIGKDPIKARYLPQRKGDIKRSAACICQAKTYLHFAPKTGLEAGLSKTLDAYSVQNIR